MFVGASVGMGLKKSPKFGDKVGGTGSGSLVACRDVTPELLPRRSSSLAFCSGVSAMEPSIGITRWFEELP